MNPFLKKFRSETNGERRAEFYLQISQRIKSYRNNQQTVLIGINAPQGAGKSTLCEAIVAEGPGLGFSCATLSIDDFYLTHFEQLALAKRNPGDPALQQRGYPGTHDVALGTKILSHLKGLKNGGEVLCPQYDKSAFQGEGDRLPTEKWKNICGPLDIILLEGWMLGFPVKEYEPWHELLDAFIFLEPKEIGYVIDWRVEAEEKRKAKGESGMSREAVTRYVEKFIPAYENYYPLLKKSMVRWSGLHHCVIQKNRLP